MNVRLHKISIGLAASITILAAIPTAQAADGKYGSIYAVDPYGKIVRDPFGRCIRTPQWTPEKDVPECGAPVAVAPQPVIKEYTLGAETLFEFDKYNLKPTGKAKLDELVTDMRQFDVNSIGVAGHTDSKGTEEYNQGLSERRAATVKNFLVSQGVDPALITAEGRGELKPVAPNTLPNGRDNPEGRAQNRRVEIKVEGTQKVQQ
jgi:OOP family OmpA-OmpF porin